MNQGDKTEFSTLFFKNDWPTARVNFLRKYSIAFTENKKKDLSFTFGEETSLRSFVHRKIRALSQYTSLSIENQLEMILIDLPNEIANLFIINEKLKCKKEEILEFCDSIQEFVEGLNDIPAGSITPSPHSISDAEDTVTQDLDIFNYEPDDTEVSSVRAKRNRSTRGNIKGSRPVGRPRKTLSSISEDSETSFFDSSQSTTGSASRI